MTPADELWDALQGDEPIFGSPHDDVPAVCVNMVMSVDGVTTIDGRVGRLTGPADQALLHRLRAEADTVMVGAGTVRAEGYRRLLPPHERERRAHARGAEEPALSIVTSDPSRLAGCPALAAGPSALIFLTSSRGELPAGGRPLVAIRSDDVPAAGARLSVRPLLRRLRQDHGMTRVTCEGGPTLNATLLAEDLVTDLFVAFSPLLVQQVGGLKLVEGGADLRRLRLIAVAAREDFVFARYRPAA